MNGAKMSEHARVIKIKSCRECPYQFGMHTCIAPELEDVRRLTQNVAQQLIGVEPWCPLEEERQSEDH